jgi:UDP-N-acetylmuramoyl-L-alanyl-D-glutamate--2,6-diaminopimelate ligase
MADGRVIAVAGAGGDRDRDKRPLMGQAVAKADVAIVTSDNPRSEDPDQIIASVVAGIDDRSHLTVEPDRRMAIERAISAAEVGDVVLILGRGHEPLQESKKGSIEFDDRIVVREALSAATDATETPGQSGSMRQ